MGHWVTKATSDYFEGYCDIPECTERPCLSCVAAQRKQEADEQQRRELIGIYRRYHDSWPKSVFLDEVIALLKPGPG